MSTIHTIYRSGKQTSVGLPKFYNLDLLKSENFGKTTKSYSLTPAVVTKIKDSVIKLYNERNHNITFWTFNFKIDDNTRHVVTDQQLMNKYFSTLIENTKKTFGLKRYIWVSERTGQGCIHYHCIFDLPLLQKKTQFKNYVQYFKNSFADYLGTNGVTTASGVDYGSIGFPDKHDKHGNHRGSVVRNLESVTRYLCGYLAKQSERREYGGRIYGISRNVLQKPVKSFKSLPLFAEPTVTYKHKYCTVNYYNYTAQFDKIFKYYSQLPTYKVESDLKRDALTEKKVEKILYVDRKYVGKTRKNVVKNENSQEKPKTLQQIINANSVHHYELVNKMWTIQEEMQRIEQEREILIYNWLNFRTIDINHCPF